jgi:hypothetical protein
MRKLPLLLASFVLTQFCCARPVSSSQGSQESETAQVAQNSAEPETNEAVSNTIQESPEERRERMNLPFKFAPERLSVKAPEGEVPLGNPVEITLTLAPGQLAGIFTVQRRLAGPVYHGSGQAKIVRDEGNAKTIEIIPAQLGSIDLDVTATYSDNAVATQTIHLNVVPSAKGLKKFFIDGGTTVMSIAVEDTKEGGQTRLNPSVTYGGLEDLIHIGTCEQIKISVEQPGDEGDPIVDVDKNCIVHAHREGKAYVVGDFDGVKDRVLVTVYSKEDSPYSWGTP